jgi:hypothetical protein
MHYWLTFRFFIYSVICIGIWYGGQFYSAREMLHTLETPPSEAIFVDQSITTGTHPAKTYLDRYDTFTHKLLSFAHLADFTDKQNGSLIFPFATITDALASAQENNVHTVVVASGTYIENITLPDNFLLLGQGDVTIIGKEGFSQDVVRMGNRSTLYNLHVSGGKTAVFIPHATAANIINVTTSDARDYGIEMEYSSYWTAETKKILTYSYLSLTEEEINALPLVHLNNITSLHNRNQGIYLADGRVLIENSHIVENGEEGIDLHPHMIATIVNTESARNGEGGMETEIYDNIVTISNSVFDSNTKSGMAFITSLGIGEILLDNLTISNNQQYGISCAIHTNRPARPRPFFQNMITRKNIIFENNILSKNEPECFTF